MILKTAAEFIAEAQEKISCVNVEDAKALFDQMDEATVLDVREAENAAQSKLSDSINISRGLLEMKMPKACPNADTLILTHCGGGGRASLAALTLVNMGYTRVHAITASYDDIKAVFG
jgi:phage shock protein E